MTERPIIFSGAMVRAILDGRKTQTRRILKNVTTETDGRIRIGGKNQAGIYAPDRFRRWGHMSIHFPYAVGDRLWVRETWSSPYCYAEFRPRDCGGPFWYWADGNPTDGDWSRPRPSIHMPKWAARIWLAVTEVRVQRLQDISEEDARAEGLHHLPVAALHAFQDQWNAIHGASAWAANPWVAAISFERAS